MDFGNSQENHQKFTRTIYRNLNEISDPVGFDSECVVIKHPANSPPLWHCFSVANTCALNMRCWPRRRNHYLRNHFSYLHAILLSYYRTSWEIQNQRPDSDSGNFACSCETWSERPCSLYQVYILYICYIYSIYKYILHCYIVEQYTIISKTQVILPDFSSVLLMRAEYYIVKGERCKLKSESAPARKILSTMAASTPASKPERWHLKLATVGELLQN